MQTSTITSKNQMTLPAGIVRKIGLKSGQKILVTEDNGKVVLTPVHKLIEDLAGSVKTPVRWKNKSMDEIIEQAKKDNFRSFK